MLAIMDEAAVQYAENNPNYSPEGWNITRGIVPKIQYTPTEKDSYDGIVFLLGHSEFRGELCHIRTRRDFKQRTLLIANVGNTCVWFSHPKLFEAFIRTRFTDALSYLSTNIEDFIHTTKARLSKMPKMMEKINTIPHYKKFFESTVKPSRYSNEYCEREWQFYNQDDHTKVDGRAMLLRRDEKGKPYFTVLYKNDIAKGGFRLMKSELYYDLYHKYHLRNVLLVDFGCTDTRRVDEYDLERLHRGQFGGTKKNKK